MKTGSGRTVSSWMVTADVLPGSALSQDISADVCIVGAGIAGMSVAYLLSRQGKSVVVLDDGPVAGGETCRTTAHLSNALDDRYFEIERLHGEDGAKLAAESHFAAIERIGSIVAEEQINCDFERLDGYLFAPPGESTEILDRELDAARRAGVEVDRIGRSPLDCFDTGPCLRFKDQGQFHPLKYISALAGAVQRAGGKIYTHTHADQIKGGEDAHVITSGGPVVRAKSIVVATNTPVNDLVAIHTKQAPYRTYVIGARMPRGAIPRALYWDTPDPYHYVRLQTVNGSSQEAHDLLIVGGEDHKTGQAHDFDERYAHLESWSRQRFPMMQQIEFRWSGQVMEPIDGLAFIGPNPMDEPNVFIATGDSGHGMTHGTIAGILLTDLILGRENPWAGLYDPSRKTLGAISDFAKENLNVAAKYADWVTAGEVKSPEQIVLGHGAVLRRGMHKVAVYRDQAGQFHEFSATCPHLGCIVSWNGLEKTWDCPCHGSRFDTQGQVVNGPAIGGLKPAEKNNDS